MSQIFLLRHGEVQGGKKLRGKTDEPLTSKGWQQMHHALINMQFDRVISSPLLRCAEFATEYAHLQQLPIKITTDLAEIDFGDWDGLTYEALFAEPNSAAERYFSDPYSHTIPNGESMADFATRVENVIELIAKRYKEQRVLVVTHGGVIRHFLTHLLGFNQAQIGAKYLPIEIGHGALIKLACYQSDSSNPQFCWQI
ncbi:histidine phosphatase family protein [Pseudoalteromonas tunicata]|uniref:Alpha-ribazole-5'-phosphate phosphatase, putative n=1 Tax=Pseudoalteromonas tunicata D2 TaxID=87626 RepID=A4C9U0_9GAMM|nr:alpha-ribazole phosphatase family protein [Pseudoalteromonas tunicata]ATC94693.1 alpha-ribazole phosphatase [Pseudoalteromonas tunicata]AXT30411.1 histidine phosphatase family protein [Pseudoalteromonas tunicata]EAR28148.1 alpha-ribazole-5'-phosphate phosphatase, putative [Pseudoalteromonas tunicata D2]